MLKEPIEFGAMCWGSCQYDAAAAFYADLLETELVCGRDAILQQFGQSLGIACSAESVYDQLVTEMKDNWNVDTGDDGDQEMYDTVLEVEKTYPEKIISNCFNMCREMSWDLWSAAPRIARLVFPNLDLDKLPETSEDETYGPCLNKLVQRENGPTGFCCWLLKMFGYAEESDFVGFDT